MMKEMINKVATRLNDLFETMGYVETVFIDTNEYTICGHGQVNSTSLNGTESNADVINAVIDQVRELNGINPGVSSELYEQTLTDCSTNHRNYRNYEKWKNIAKSLYEGLASDDVEEAIKYVTETLELSDDVLEEFGIDKEERDRDAMRIYINHVNQYEYDFDDYDLDRLIEMAIDRYTSSEWKIDVYEREFIRYIKDKDTVIEDFKHECLDCDGYCIIEDAIDWDDVDFESMVDATIYDTYMIIDDEFVVVFNF